MGGGAQSSGPPSPWRTYLAHGLSGPDMPLRPATDTLALMNGTELALRGLREAAAALSPDDEGASILRASEALFWAAALDEQIDPGRRHTLAPAIGMARNAVAHGVVICAGVTEGVVWPLRWPLKWSELLWAPTEAVRAGLDRRVKDSTIELYEAHIAGRNVQDILEELIAWYDQRIA